jgi:hypothetical protein
LNTRGKWRKIPFSFDDLFNEKNRIIIREIPNHNSLSNQKLTSPIICHFDYFQGGTHLPIWDSIHRAKVVHPSPTRRLGFGELPRWRSRSGQRSGRRLRPQSYFGNRFGWLGFRLLKSTQEILQCKIKRKVFRRYPIPKSELLAHYELPRDLSKYI